jgi:hypothetical protein
MNGGRESRRPRPALGCSANNDDDDTNITALTTFRENTLCETQSEWDEPRDAMWIVSDFRV